MKEPPLLSLCVPTYNRSKLLDRTLEAIGKELKSVDTDDVEIVISDNGSSDDTSATVQRFGENHPELQITYKRHEKNRGIDTNIYSAAVLARGAHVFLFSDDDLVEPGGIARIIDVLRKEETTVLICPNFEAIRDDSVVSRPWITANEAIERLNRDEAWSRLGTHVTYLSCLIFPRSFLDGHNYESRIGSYLLCSYLFVDMIRMGKEVLLLGKPCIRVRANERVGYNVADVFIGEFRRVISYAETVGFSQWTTNCVLDAHAAWLVGALRHFGRTSYRPNLWSRVRDTVTVLRGWQARPVSALRVITAIWATW